MGESAVLIRVSLRSTGKVPTNDGRRHRISAILLRALSLCGGEVGDDIGSARWIDLIGDIVLAECISLQGRCAIRENVKL